LLQKSPQLRRLRKDHDETGETMDENEHPKGPSLARLVPTTLVEAPGMRVW
jgi:hypothetical protein